MGKVQRRDCTEFTEKKARDGRMSGGASCFLCALGDPFARFAVKSFKSFSPQRPRRNSAKFAKKI
jgi:hypothetical protein